MGVPGCVLTGLLPTRTSSVGLSPSLPMPHEDQHADRRPGGPSRSRHLTDRPAIVGVVIGSDPWPLALGHLQSPTRTV